jgi:DNA polymerase III alpha subunit (gram-positive type)
MNRSTFYLVSPEDLHKSLRYKNWRNLTLGIFDLETTGVNVFDSADTKIVQFCGVLAKQNRELDKLNVLINPQMIIPTGASDVHHIYNESVEDKPAMHEAATDESDYTVAEKIHDFLAEADVLVAYNGLTFDLPLLQRELSDAGCGNFSMPIIDPLVFYRKAKEKMSKTRLEDAAINYSVQGIGGVAHGLDLLHDAEVDVRMLKEVVWAMGSSDIPWSLDQTLAEQYKLIQKQADYLCKRYGEPEPALEHYIGPDWQQQYEDRNK